MAHFDQVCSLAKMAMSENPHPIIAIDGYGGAGKSTLARRLRDSVAGYEIIENDWFHLPRALLSQEHRFDAERLKREVLLPFKSGCDSLTFNRYNWGYLVGKPDECTDPLTIHAAPGLIVEGCMTLAAELCPHYDLRIWVDTPQEIALEQGTRRDIEEYGIDSKKVEEMWGEWQEWEVTTMGLEDRRLRADLQFQS